MRVQQSKIAHHDRIQEDVSSSDIHHKLQRDQLSGERAERNHVILKEKSNGHLVEIFEVFFNVVHWTSDE